MATKWIYSSGGETSFYQQGKYIYSYKTNTCEYFEQGGYLYPMNGGTGAAFYVRDRWIYTIAGSADYFYG